MKVTNRVIRDTAFAAFKVVLIFSVQASPGHRGILDRRASTQGVQVPGDDWGRLVVEASQVLIMSALLFTNLTYSFHRRVSVTTSPRWQRPRHLRNSSTINEDV